MATMADGDKISGTRKFKARKVRKRGKRSETNVTRLRELADVHWHATHGVAHREVDSHDDHLNTSFGHVTGTNLRKAVRSSGSGFGSSNGRGLHVKKEHEKESELPESAEYVLNGYK
jgi:hypothetical protein